MINMYGEEEETEEEFNTRLELEKEQKIRSALKDVQEKAEKKVYADYLIQQYKILIESKEDLTSPFLIAAREAFQLTTKLYKQKVSSEHYWVSVNPSNDKELDELIKKVDKYVGRRFITGIIYTYEWCRNGTPHVHMLVHQLELSDKDFRKNTKNTFKNLVGNLKCIDIKRVPSDWIQDKIDYLQGNKWDPEKDDMIESDKLKREEFELEPYYAFGSFAPQEGGHHSLDGPPLV